jgi:hypothetical protein
MLLVRITHDDRCTPISCWYRTLGSSRALSACAVRGHVYKSAQLPKRQLPHNTTHCAALRTCAESCGHFTHNCCTTTGQSTALSFYC